MAGANTSVQMADLDFNKIKDNLKTFLQSQDTLKDYNYEGSALSTLLDVLAYNTQYNAYYLNMVANEMFLDTAIQRASVVSHAKNLSYIPKSYSAPTATIQLNVNNVVESSLTIPQFTNFMSEAIDGVNYNFVNADEVTVNTINGVATYNDLELKQGIPSNLTYQVNYATNPTATFEIPETTVDTSTINIVVQDSYSNTSSETYTLATDYLSLDDTSKVYFLQEGVKGTYEIYFGDGILGKKLNEGNIVYISYLITQGLNSAGANNFSLMDTINGYSSYTINPIGAASQGSAKESITSIKFQAPKSYAAQNRAVTKEDYITIIQQNKFNIPVQSVSVWGGEEADPPKYGAIYAAVKPEGAYVLTDFQKQVLINDVIKPVSVMTVVPEIVDVDYVYLIMSSDILYDTKKTTLTSSQISTLVKQGIIDFSAANLNTFNSTFVASDLTEYIKGLNNAIIAADIDVYLQKRLVPKLNDSSDYTINFGNAIEQGLGKKRVTISPSFSQYDSSASLIGDVFFEESSDPTLAGTLQTYYYENNIKNILTNSTTTSNAGTIDYTNGVVKLSNFVPNRINSNDGLLRINASADSRIISSTYNRVITLDELDPLAITVNVRIK
jgi:hypothetical protein